MKSEIDILKIKREFLLIKDKIPNMIITDEYEYPIEFIIVYFKYLNDVSIIQYSRFGFIISYVIYYKDKVLIDFDEKLLPLEYNRHSINKIILSEINKKRHNKFKIKNKIRELSEIDY